MIVVAGFLALILNPLVVGLQRRRIRRRGWACAAASGTGTAGTGTIWAPSAVRYARPATCSNGISSALAAAAPVQTAPVAAHQQHDPPFLQLLSVPAQPDAHRRQRQFHECGQRSGFDPLHPWRRQDVEPSVHNQQRGRCGGRRGQITRPAEREIGRAGQRQCAARAPRLIEGRLSSATQSKSVVSHPRASCSRAALARASSSRSQVAGTDCQRCTT
jgi:hypothetical protein